MTTCRHSRPIRNGGSDAVCAAVQRYMKLAPINPGGVIDADPGDLPGVDAEVLRAVGSLYDLVGFEPPWICYIALENDAAVGTCGFKSPPRDGRVEIAYFTFPGNEGRGLATRMVGELVALAKKASPNVSVTAQTLIERSASHRVLEKIGFMQIGQVETPDEGPVLEWQEVTSCVA